ncbi:hypothetical protein QR680_013784 [Steinernema hermaphroditum]|uniref:SET domain-containing protein n=1 Tax=Steinernema hermaphroditum TaxID=289476 RepID=A0AA39I6N7_9BILA|nr:hypothetical protein QR680_013784 [Steinernema hermaphroditum]
MAPKSRKSSRRSTASRHAADQTFGATPEDIPDMITAVRTLCSLRDSAFVQNLEGEGRHRCEEAIRKVIQAVVMSDTGMSPPESSSSQTQKQNSDANVRTPKRSWRAKWAAEDKECKENEQSYTHDDDKRDALNISEVREPSLESPSVDVVEPPAKRFRTASDKIEDHKETRMENSDAGMEGEEHEEQEPSFINQNMDAEDTNPLETPDSAEVLLVNNEMHKDGSLNDVERPTVPIEQGGDVESRIEPVEGHLTRDAVLSENGMDMNMSMQESRDNYDTSPEPRLIIDESSEDTEDESKSVVEEPAEQQQSDNHLDSIESVIAGKEEPPKFSMETAAVTQQSQQDDDFVLAIEDEELADLERTHSIEASTIEAPDDDGDTVILCDNVSALEPQQESLDETAEKNTTEERQPNAISRLFLGKFRVIQASPDPPKVDDEYKQQESNEQMMKAEDTALKDHIPDADMLLDAPEDNDIPDDSMTDAEQNTQEPTETIAERSNLEDGSVGTTPESSVFIDASTPSELEAFQKLLVTTENLRTRKNTDTESEKSLKATSQQPTLKAARRRNRNDSLAHFVYSALEILGEHSDSQDESQNTNDNSPYNVFNSHWARKLKTIRTITFDERDMPESKPQRKLNAFLQLGLVQKFNYLEERKSIFGKGVFATEPIKADRYVVDYPCRAMSSEEFSRMYEVVSEKKRKKIDRQRMHFDIPEKAIDYVFCALDVDDKKKRPLWNGEPVKFYGHRLNHSSKHPNVKPVVKHRVDDDGNRIAIVIFRSLRDIKKGEELLWDYTADGVSPHLEDKPWLLWCPCRKCEGKCWCDVCKGKELHLAVVY